MMISVFLKSMVRPSQAREIARGKKAIGTTGRGIGPAYEDKVARPPNVWQSAMSKQIEIVPEEIVMYFMVLS